MSVRKRAPKGYGRPFQDTRGYWNIQIPNGTERGRTIYKRIRCKTIEGLREKQQAFETKRARGMRSSKRGPTLATFLRQWLDLSVAARNRYRTQEGYAQIVETYLIPWLDPRDTVPIDAVEREAGQAMINTLARGSKHWPKLAPRTIRNIRSCLRRALNVAKHDGLVLRNIAEALEVPKEPAVNHPTLDPRQARHLLWTAEEDWYEALYWTALLMGFREGELCGMRLDDLDLERGTITPRHGLQRQRPDKSKPGVLVSVPLKTEASYEALPIPAVLIPILRAHLERLAEARTQSTWVESGMLFPCTKGTPLEPRNLIRAFDKLCMRAGIEGITFHSLRHTCGTLLAEMGQHPKVIQAVLRHASHHTTMKFYVHARDVTQAAATEGLAAMLTDSVLELPQKEPVQRG